MRRVILAAVVTLNIVAGSAVALGLPKLAWLALGLEVG